MHAQTKTEHAYNGWTNYETWNIHLWITNSQGSDLYWRERAEELREEADDSRPDCWTKEQYVKFTMADELKQEFNDAEPLQEWAQNGPYGDLLSAALSTVDWNEVAEALIEE